MWHIVNKSSVKASTGLIQLACLASHDSLHLRTHLQLLLSVLLAAVPLNMRGDRGCLFTHDVQTIVGIRKATMLQNIGSVLRIYASLTARMLWWKCYRSLAQLKTPLICDIYFLMQLKKLIRTGAVWAPATALWPSAFYRPWLDALSTPLFASWTSWNNFKNYFIAMARHDIAQQVIKLMKKP